MKKCLTILLCLTVMMVSCVCVAEESNYETYIHDDLSYLFSYPANDWMPFSRDKLDMALLNPELPDDVEQLFRGLRSTMEDTVSMMLVNPNTLDMIHVFRKDTERTLTAEQLLEEKNELIRTLEQIDPSLQFLGEAELIEALDGKQWVGYARGQREGSDPFLEVRYAMMADTTEYEVSLRIYSTEKEDVDKALDAQLAVVLSMSVMP